MTVLLSGTLLSSVMRFSFTWHLINPVLIFSSWGSYEGSCVLG